jgi:hypothetical protein
MEVKRYITEVEVSKITSRALQTLRNDRHCGRGFPYVKLTKQRNRTNNRPNSPDLAGLCQSWLASFA